MHEWLADAFMRDRIPHVGLSISGGCDHLAALAEDRLIDGQSVVAKRLANRFPSSDVPKLRPPRTAREERVSIRTHVNRANAVTNLQ